MNTRFDLFDETPEEEHRHPFPEPRTMPGGWDLSALSAAASRPAASEADQPAPEAGSEAPSAPWREENFDQLRTFPAAWDLSSIVK